MSNLKLLDGTKIHKTQFNAWMKALRSGKYKQARGMLEKSYGFCCLGVACEIMGFKKQKNSLGLIMGGLPCDQQKAPVWLKLINNDFRKRTNKNIYKMNDSMGMTFDEIADTLEAVYIHGVLDD